MSPLIDIKCKLEEYKQLLIRKFYKDTQQQKENEVITKAEKV